MKLPRFEHLYCGFTIDLIYRHKWGISIEAGSRWSNIKQELSQELGRDVKVFVFPVPILYARSCEKFIFRLFKSFQYKGLKTSTGRTEYFWSINFISFALIWFLLWLSGFHCAKYVALSFSALPVPIDGFLVILIIFILQWAAIIGTFAGLIWYII